MSATATAPPAAPDGAAEVPKKGRRLVLVAVAAVVLGALGVGGYLFLAGDGDPDAKVEEAPADGPVVEVGTLTTNLAGSAHYARVGIALVLTADADTADVESRFALVKDAAISEIGSHDVASLQAATGTEQLRAGLAERIVALFPDGEVTRVVLTELLVQ